MPAIGYVQRLADGSFKGSIRTLSVNAEIQVVPNRGKMRPAESCGFGRHRFSWATVSRTIAPFPQPRR